MKAPATGVAAVHVEQRTASAGNALGAALAGAAFAWHAVLLSEATNDNFFHLTLARQLLAGDWPARDFFDHAWVLEYVLSALAQVTLGERLLSEAVVVGLMWAVSTYVVFRLVRRLTDSTRAAVVSAVLLIIAGPRGYAYPKGIVYAVAAVLWWAYQDKPTAARAAGLGAWAAVAFYWRPDHGLYVAIGIVLATLAAHGVRSATVARTAVAGVTAAALAVPFVLYVQFTVGLVDYVEAGAVHGKAEHTTHGTHDLPLVRYSRELFVVEPASRYAPVMTIRWKGGTTTATRQDVMARYGLTHVSTEDPLIDRVRLSTVSFARARELLNDPAVEDTAGIDRATATVPRERWPAWQRWCFTYPVLRIRVLSNLDAHARASEILVAVFYVMPFFALVFAGWLARYLPDLVTGTRIALFAVFALIVDAGLLRTPYTARAVDAVVLPAILLGCCSAALWRAGAARRRGGTLLRLSAIGAAVIVVMAVSAGADFGGRISVLAGQWTSLTRARTAWSEVSAELTASPPLSYYLDRPAEASVRLAAYVRECVPASDRLLVLWFAPEIYYHSDRLMAQRHLVFVPAWAALETEQRLTLDRIRRFAPPLALVRRSALDTQARATFPTVVGYVEREYAVAGRIEEEGEEYLIFARRDRVPVRGFGPDRWPCYARESSIWSRVGRTAE